MQQFPPLPEVPIRQLIGGLPLRPVKAGELCGPCPICREGDDRFHVFTDRNAWWCRRCTGTDHLLSPADLLMRRDGLTFREAAERLRRDYGDPSPYSPQPAPGTDRSRTTYYTYQDEQGRDLFRVVRIDSPSGKRIHQEHPDPDHPGSWLPGVGGVCRVLFRTPELAAADPAQPVLIAEGEACTDALMELGYVATTAPGGAGKWQPAYHAPLAGRDVSIFADCDPPGRTHARQVAAALHGTARSVRILDLDPGRSDGYDIADWIREGHGRAELDRLIALAPPWQPPEQPAPERRCRILKGAAIWSQPTPSWRVDGVLPDGLIELFGPSGSYKSFIALDIACRVALGQDWQGHATLGGPVLYICAEGSAGMAARYCAWCKRFSGGEAIAELCFVPHPIFPHDREIMADLEAAMADQGVARPAMVIFDTLARSFIGDENSTESMGAFVRAIGGLRERTGSTIMIIHHTGWDESRPRGASALRAALDCEVRAVRDELGTVSLSCSKMKDAEEFTMLRFTLAPVAGTDSCVIVPADAAPAAAPALPAVHTAIVAALVAAGLEGLSFAELKLATGTTRDASMIEAVQSLIARRLVTATGDAGRRGRRYYATEAARVMAN